MAIYWDSALIKASEELISIKKLLSELSEQEPVKLIKVKPFMLVMVTACDFLTANIEIIRNTLAE